MSTLIVVTHPTIGQSVVNKRWISELHKYPQQFTVHELYRRYPDGRIDVAEEQARVEAHDALVLQFPVYWFNCPPLLKQWFDEVLTHGWAYGSRGHALQARKVALAVSMGTPAEDYSPSGAIGYGVSDVLRSFELTARYCKADYRPPFTFHTIDSNDGYTEEALASIEKSASDYVQWLMRL